MSEDVTKKLNDEALDAVAGGRQSDLAVAYDVIEGRYGNGEERVRRLRAAGYDPVVIQAIVNSLVSGGRVPPRDPYLDPKKPVPDPYQDPYLGR